VGVGALVRLSDAAEVTRLRMDAFEGCDGGELIVSRPMKLGGYGEHNGAQAAGL